VSRSSPNLHKKKMDPFDISIRFLLDKNNDQAKIEQAFSMYIRVLKNVISHPSEAKYRTVKSGSAAYKTKISELEGGDGVMSALGFTHDTASLEWRLTPTPDAWNLIQSCLVKLERFHARLTAAATTAAAAATATTATATTTTTTATPAAPAAAVPITPSVGGGAGSGSAGSSSAGSGVDGAPPVAMDLASMQAMMGVFLATMQQRQSSQSQDQSQDQSNGSASSGSSGDGDGDGDGGRDIGTAP